MRLVHTQVCPAFLYLLASVPLTASFISASSNTMEGALPPNSSDTFLIVDALCAINILPTSVDPVNDTFFTFGCSVNTLPTTFELDVVIILTTPGGKPASI